MTPDRGTQDGVRFTVCAKLCGYGMCNLISVFTQKKSASLLL